MKTLPAFVSSSIVLSCWLCMAQSEPKSDSLRNLAKGAFSGITDARQEVITNRNAWERVWTRHAVRSYPPQKLPEIDSGKEMVIMVTMGRKSTGGYAIEIMSVVEAADRLQITVKRTTPRPGAMTIQALTAPYHFVAVPRSDLKPQFIEAKSAGTK
ncbi:MAG: protease complex subunit PrcB family protein [Chloroflexi bacterium]|nr:protease complex subunit PrcB family protein [Chloroflexota bacterium]